MTPVKVSTRRGITLMEVLIAIGILSIGLTSVAALLPAGGSQARKAIISDRAATLAENALADAITIGLTRPASLTGTPAQRVVVDPATVGGLALSGMPDVSLQTSGVPAALLLFSQGRDDIVFDTSTTEDSLPRNAFVDGARGFDGRTTCLWAIESLDSGVLTAGKLARLSAVVFHDRDPSSRKVAATVSATGEITFTEPLPAGRTVRDVLKTGSVLVIGVGDGRSCFFGIRSASVNATGDGAFCVFDQQPPATACTILLDSVGLAQTYVTLEGSGPFSSITPREVVP